MGDARMKGFGSRHDVSEARSWTIDELCDALADAHREVASYFGELTDDELYRREPGEWAPIDDLRHLTLSVRPVVRALRMPKEALRERFGEADGPSRSYGELRAAYRAELDAGLTSPDRFVPPDEEPEDRASFRKEVLDEWKVVGRELREALGEWDAEVLDRLVLPHPAMGLLTVREMLCFTHLHGLHHVEVAKRRLAA